MGSGLMASAWGQSWGSSWGNSWGDLVFVPNKAAIRSVNIGIRQTAALLQFRKSGAMISVREIAADAVQSHRSRAEVDTASSKADVTLSTAE